MKINKKRQQRMIYLILLTIGFMYYAKRLLITPNKITAGFFLGIAFVCAFGSFYTFLEMIYFNFIGRVKIKEIKK